MVKLNDRHDITEHFINEAKTKILTELENKFGKDKVYSTKLDFEFDDNNVWYVFDILNNNLFENKLKRPTIYRCTNDDIQKIVFKTLGIKREDNFYALYLNHTNNKNKSIKDEIFIIDDYGKMTFLFAVNSLCHEMIHYYDLHYGNVKQILEKHDKLDDIVHYTPVFQGKMLQANKEGLKVMVNGNNTPFDILNIEAVQHTVNLQESEYDIDYSKIIENIKNGKKYKHIGYKDGNIVFAIS